MLIQLQVPEFFLEAYGTPTLVETANFRFLAFNLLQVFKTIFHVLLPTRTLTLPADLAERSYHRHQC